MYGFCRNTDLGISHFNFSSKNCTSKVYICFAKVVGLLTKSTEKLGLQFLDFSTILYVFYKLQLKHNKGEETFCWQTPGKFQTFTNLPVACTKHPGSFWGLAMCPLGAWGGAACRIPARPAAGMAEEG
jgi:hypothetical protein